MKLLAFDAAVNTTLGLPFLRTSPDHGTAFGIAGRGVARSGRRSGDHYYRIQIVAPEASIGNNRRLLEALEQENPRRRERRDPADGADLD